MRARLAKYFICVFSVFVVLGPLFAILPGIWNPAIVLGAWMVGALPALAAAVYYFVLTFWWYDTLSRVKSHNRFGLFGLIGAICGMLGILSAAHLPIPLSQFEQLFFSRTTPALFFGAVGGLGSAALIVLLCGRSSALIPAVDQQ